MRLGRSGRATDPELVASVRVCEPAAMALMVESLVSTNSPHTSWFCMFVCGKIWKVGTSCIMTWEVGGREICYAHLFKNKTNCIPMINSLQGALFLLVSVFQRCWYETLGPTNDRIYTFPHTITFNKLINAVWKLKLYHFHAVVHILSCNTKPSPLPWLPQRCLEACEKQAE